jgi:hypothetical protein
LRGVKKCRRQEEICSSKYGNDSDLSSYLRPSV